MAFISLHLLRIRFSSPVPPKPLHLSSLSSNHPQSPAKATFSHIFQECSYQRCLSNGKQAHARMITSGFTPTVFVTNCLINMYVKCSSLDYAHKVFYQMHQRDTISWNAMISGYAQIGSMGDARALFDGMSERDVISWNSLISGYLQNSDAMEAVGLFGEMGRDGMCWDHTTFATVLKACSSLGSYEFGIQIHGITVRMGLDRDVVTGSALVDMYAKCLCLGDSLRVFYEMPERNWVSWSAIIAGFVQNEQLMGALMMFNEMQRAGIGMSQSAYACVLRSCAGLCSVILGRQIHGHALKSNFSSDNIVGTAILDMYAKCDSLGDARRVFQSLPVHSLASWNAMVIGYTRNGQGLEAMKLFRLMNNIGVVANEISLSGVLSACAGVEAYLEGSNIHSLAIKNSFVSEICVANAILDMYGKCGALVEACSIFEEMDIRDAVSWNAIITALEQNGRYEETLLHYSQMLHHGMEPEEFTFGSVLKACSGLPSLSSGIKIQGRIIKSQLGLHSFVGSALVDMYSKCGNMDEAEKIHDRIENQTTVSWNAIISGFALQKQSEEAQRFFSKMLNMGLKPDNFTYATLLDTCANLVMIGLGKQIHTQVIKEQLMRDVFITSTLVDMYSKCGHMHDSLLMFERIPVRDFVSWNAMISGYAQHGLGHEALSIYERMKLENVKPNHATFVAVLRACGHVGLVDAGLKYFHSMRQDYELEPQLEHYSCMVDIIGREGRIQESLELIHNMPHTADAVIWRTLLVVCKMHRNVEIAELAASNILQLDPDDSAVYVLLSNIYAEAGRWGDVSKMRQVMRYNKVKKEPGCSWIEVKSEVHMFLIGDKAHPRCGELYERLDELLDEMRWAGYVPDMDFIQSNNEEGEQMMSKNRSRLATRGQ